MTLHGIRKILSRFVPVKSSSNQTPLPFLVARVLESTLIDRAAQLSDPKTGKRIWKATHDRAKANEAKSVPGQPRLNANPKVLYLISLKEV
jgi:hypothetical protein